MASGVQIGTAFIEVTADTTNAFSNVSSSASNAGTQAGGKFSGAFGKGLAGMGTALAGAFAVDKITGFLGSAITGASDLNEETSKSQTIFGTAAGSIKTWAQSAATGVGLSESAALKATGTFGNMFTQLGFGGDAAAAMSKDVIGLSADLGSFNNLPTADVADMMGAAFRGEFDSIQALLPGINAATVETKALEMSGKTAASALTEQEKAAAVLALAHQGGAMAAGDFAKTQGGMAGQTKIAEANLANMSASIGSVLLPVANSLMSFVNTNLIPGLVSIGSFIQTDVVPAITAFSNGFMDALPTITTIASIIGAVLLPALVRSAIQAAVTAAANVAGWVSMAVGAVVNAATVVGAWVLMGIQSMLQAARMAAAWIIAMGPVGWVIALVIGLVAVIVANWDTISRVTTEVFNAVMTFLSGVWTNIVTFLGQAWANIVSFVTDGVNTANAIITSVFNAISSFISSVFNGIVSFISGAWNNMVSFVSNGVSMAHSIIVSVFSAVAGFVSAIFNNIVSFISGAFANAVSFVSNGVNNIQSFISSGFNAAVGIVSGAFSNIVNAVSNGISNAVSFVSGLPGQIMGVLGNLGGLLYNSGTSLIQGFINGIKDMVGNIAGAVGGIMETARSFFPFSPAKEGPFSGKGYTSYSGEALSEGFAQGISDKTKGVQKATSGLMAAASKSLGSLNSTVSVGTTMAETNIPYAKKGGIIGGNGASVSTPAAAASTAASAPAVKQQKVELHVHGNINSPVDVNTLMNQLEFTSMRMG